MTTFLAPISPREFPWYDYSHYSFSLGVTRGDGVWLSGHSASEFDPETRHIVVKGGMREQAMTAYAKIQRILEESGCDFSDVVHVVENVTVDGIDDYAEAALVREQIFAGHAPTVSTVVVRRLLRPTALIEIEVTAFRGSGKGAASAVGDGVVALPTMLPVDNKGDVVSPGDFLGQAQFVYDRASQLLTALGLGMDHVVKTLDFTTPATRREYAATGRVRKELLGPVYPAAAGILMPRLFHDDVLFALEVTASRHEPVAVNPGWKRYEKLTYSPAVRAGSHLFLSGQGALDVETEQAVHEGDVVAQAEYIYENILTVLSAGGAGQENLVRTVEYVTPDGLDNYREVGRVRERLLAQPYPASTGIVCEGLLRKEFLLEVDPLAVLA